MNKCCRLADSVSKAPVDNSVGKAPIVTAAVRKAQRVIEKLL
jgi:hypothetical protein